MGSRVGPRVSLAVLHKIRKMICWVKVTIQCVQRSSIPRRNVDAGAAILRAILASCLAGRTFAWLLTHASAIHAHLADSSVMAVVAVISMMYILGEGGA